uniref:Carboxypeptidase regulatory-like domain-containing protein n=1 Tax=uncultured marine group II/III euryarchaeote KM3_33_F08 TaxID=1456435 RepID=A0A075H2Y6_9EURY|nr:hypothetical protein [uncultured marine group II/III euryarchaeote KM3_33_F08]
MSADSERKKRLDALRSRVRAELEDEGVLEVEEELEVVIDDEDTAASISLSDRVARRRRRIGRARKERKEAAYEAVAGGGDPSIVRLPAALRERAEESWVLNLAVLLILVGSILGAASGALLLSTDPRDLVSSTLFESTEEGSVHGLLLTQLDTENGTGGEGLEGVQIDLIRLSDEGSEARTESNDQGRFTLSNVAREPMLLRIQSDGYVTVERTLIPGEVPDLTITMVEGEGVDSVDLRSESYLEAALKLSTAIAVLTLISAATGIIGGMEARKCARYRRTQWLCGLGLFSRGGIFFGPLLILLGMALLMLARPQFKDQ